MISAKRGDQNPENRCASRAETLIFLGIFNDLRKKGVPKTQKNLSIELRTTQEFLFFYQSTWRISLKSCFAFLGIKSDKISDFQQNNSFETFKS